MDKKFTEKISSQWIKVKFYEKDPCLDKVAYPKSVRFCEAVKMAILEPVVLSKENVSCDSAKYIFGWKDTFDANLLDNCQDKCKISDKYLKSLLSSVPRFNKPFSYIGLNTNGEPDLLISCVLPQDMMKIIKIYNGHSGKNVDISLNSMMGLCGNVAAKAFLQEKLALSFGCLDSRKFAEIGRDRLVVGVPRKLFKMFIND